jgi:hypothetical protein
MNKRTVIVLALFLSPAKQLAAEEILAYDNATIQPAGIRQGENGRRFFNVEGEGKNEFASYGVVRFDLAELKSQYDNQFGPGGWTIDAVDLLLTQSNAAFTSDGGVEIFFTAEDEEDISQETGLLSYPFEGDFPDAVSILMYDFVQVTNGELETYTLYDASAPNSAGGLALFNDILADDIVTVALVETDPDVAATYAGYASQGFPGPTLDIAATPTRAIPLQAGDADQDLDFDQIDLVRVQIAAKYLTGLTATWGEGDWNGGPGGRQGSPPAGDGLFNQRDIIAALNAGRYLTGPYLALAGVGDHTDVSRVIYDPRTGQLSITPPAGQQFTWVKINSAAGIFGAEPAQNLGNGSANNSDTSVYRATFGSSFGALSFGNVARTGLSAEFLLSDLSVVGTLAGGGGLGDVMLVVVPEPSAALLLALGILALVMGPMGRMGPMSLRWRVRLQFPNLFAAHSSIDAPGTSVSVVAEAELGPSVEGGSGKTSSCGSTPVTAAPPAMPNRSCVSLSPLSSSAALASTLRAASVWPKNR